MDQVIQDQQSPFAALLGKNVRVDTVEPQYNFVHGELKEVWRSKVDGKPIALVVGTTLVNWNQVVKVVPEHDDPEPF